MNLPSPGPGRPHHDSYSQPSRGYSLGELVFLVLATPAALVGIPALIEAVL